MFHAYVLRSKTTGKRYVGQTSNLRKRFDDHNHGLSKYTKGRGPWQLIHSETLGTRSDAMIREKFFKSGKGREFLDTLTE